MSRRTELPHDLVRGGLDRLIAVDRHQIGPVGKGVQQRCGLCRAHVQSTGDHLVRVVAAAFNRSASAEAPQQFVPRDIEPENDRPGLETTEFAQSLVQSLGLGRGPWVAVQHRSLPCGQGLQPFRENSVSHGVWHKLTVGEQITDPVAERRILLRHLPKERAGAEVHEVKPFGQAPGLRALARTRRAHDDMSAT
jgi:hypothetical protein